MIVELGKTPKIKKGQDGEGYSQYKSTPAKNQVAPWIIPTTNYPSNNSESNPYSSINSPRNNKKNTNKNVHYNINNNNTSSSQTGNLNEYKSEKINSERVVSELDLYHLPDAFASTSSLDLLGTIAEMKLPSARSLENIEKCDLEGNGASTASLSEWYTMLGENASLSSSMTDIPSQNASTLSLSSINFNNSMDWSTNPIMPWDTKKSIKDNMNNDFHATNTINVDPMSHSINNNSNNNTPKNMNHNSMMKHSLSRELLQAAAAAVAHDEAKQEIAKILKQQYNDKLKEMTLNNNLNSNLNTNQQSSDLSNNQNQKKVSDLILFH